MSKGGVGPDPYGVYIGGYDQGKDEGKKEARKQAAKYAHWVIGQYLEKNDVQLLMQMPGKIERGECGDFNKT